MAIELRNPLTITEETKIYGHNTVDIDGVPTDAGNGNVGQIVDIVDTKYIQGIKTDIDNIKAKINGEIYRTQLVDANAYQIDVPSPVFPYAEVQKLKGKSVVWNQLKTSSSTISDEIFTTHKYLFIVTADVTEDSTNIYIYMRQSDYTENNQVTMGPYNIGTHRICWISSPSKGTSNKNAEVDCFADKSSCTFSNKMLIDLTLMFGSGNEPTLEECQKIFTANYYPYDEGTLKSFPVQRVKSVGKNLLNPSVLKDGDYDGTNSNIRVSVDVRNRIFVKKGTKISLSFKETLVVKRIWLIITDSSNNILETLFTNHTTSTTATTTKDGYVCFIFGGTLSDTGVWGAITVNDVIKANPQLEIGDITPYSPYMESTIDLSSVTTDMKSALSVADEWQNGKVTKRVGVVDLGTLSWQLKNISGYKIGYYFYINTSDIKEPKNPSIPVNILCTRFKGEKADANIFMNTDNAISLYNKTLAITCTEYTDASTFKSAMSGVMLYYELATPTEEIVPLTEQFIDVESKGTLSFISDETVQMPIESTTKFVVNLEEV